MANTIPGVDRVFAPKQISAHCSMDLDKVYALLASGALKGIRVGRTWLVTETALREFLAGNEAA